MEEIIRTLCAEYDGFTAANVRKFKQDHLLLVGGSRSVFLHQVYHKAINFGIPTNQPGVKIALTGRVNTVVVDRETNHGRLVKIPTHLDVDHQNTIGMSSCAEAIFRVLRELRLINNKFVVIVGNGHAVRDLYYQLRLYGALAVVFDSKSRGIDLFTLAADVVIYATPVLTQSVEHSKARLIIDLAGVVPLGTIPASCTYLRHIGPLTVSVLLRRVSGWRYDR